MKRTMFVAAALALSAVMLVHLVPADAKSDAPNPDEAAIKTLFIGYVAAYNKNDADVVALHFANDSEYTDDDGRVVRGRENIRKEYAQLFSTAKGVKIETALDSMRRLSADAFAVNGHAAITQPDGGKTNTKYAVVVAKRDGAWLIADVRELSSDTATEASPLDALGWMVGEWADASDDIDVTAVCDWTANKHFLMRSHTVTVNGEIDLQGTEVIAYDAAAKQIRSWMFDSDGMFTESIWKQNGKTWVVTTKGVIADGKHASAVINYTFVDDNTLLYSSTNRDIGGQLQPNIPEIKMVRRAAGQ